MLAFFLLWLVSLLVSLWDIGQYLIAQDPISSIFLPMIFVVFFPGVSMLLSYIRHDEEWTSEILRPSPFLVFLLVLFSFSILFWVHPTALSWMGAIIGIASLLSMIDSRANFTLALLFLSATIASLLVDKKDIAELFSIYTYYSLVWGVVAELLSPYIRRLFGRWQITSWYPQGWSLYLSEMRFILSTVLLLFPYLFVFFVYFILRDVPLWRLQFHDDLLGLLTVLAYASLAVVWYHWKWGIYRSIPARIHSLYKMIRTRLIRSHRS